MRTRVSRAPWAVRLHVAALVGDDEVKASWAVYETAGESTAWTMLVATAERLISVELEFGAAGYDFDADTMPRFEHNPVQTTVRAAWVRDLKSVVRIDIGSCATRFKDIDDGWYPIGDVCLTFADGDEVGLRFNQLEMESVEDRDRSDEFLAAVRAGAGL